MASDGSDASVTLWLSVSGTRSGKVTIPDRILGCLAYATFGELLELAESLPDAIVLRPEAATSCSFRYAKAVSLETPMSVSKCRVFYFLFRPSTDSV